MNRQVGHCVYKDGIGSYGFKMKSIVEIFPVPTPSYVHVANPHVNTNFR